MIKKNQIITVILCGGSGSRLWPYSRKNFPKQFLELHEEKSLFHSALERAKIFSQDTSILLSVSKDLESQAWEAASNFDNITALVEPENKGTGPAICLAALVSEAIHKDSFSLVLPADLYIQVNNSLLEAVNDSIEEAITSWITFGIKPTFPSIDLGYIETHLPHNKISDVKAFIEKPQANIAKELIKKSNIFWNSGIFLSKASNIIGSFELLSNHTYKNGMDILAMSDLSNKSMNFDHHLFQKFVTNSVDYEILEHEKSISCVELQTHWKDLGTWQAVSDLFVRDAKGNSSNSELVAINAENNFIFSEKELAVINGVEDILVVESGDSILVTKKSNPTSLRDIYQHLEDNSYEEINSTGLSYRPWGKFESLFKKDNMQIKILTINPGECISLQTHEHRCENWLVLEGEATVTLDTKVFTLKENDTVFIPQGHLHRLANESEKSLKILECQRGSYLGEDDIKRYEDVYNRN